MAHIFKFSLENPLLKGTLFKKGGVGKLFKRRFFVLYPGFLVYYDDVLKWKADVWKGDTLGGRSGAIYLKDGTCNSYVLESKRLHFGISVHGPDKRNQRKHLEMSALNADEQETWISTIRQAIPHGVDQSECMLYLDAGKNPQEAISRENTPDQRASLEISGSSSGYEDSLPSPQRRRAVSAIVGAASYSPGDSSGVIQQTVSWEEAEAKVGYCITVVNMAGSPHFGNKRNDDDTIDVEEPNEIPLYAEVKKQPKLKL